MSASTLSEIQILQHVYDNDQQALRTTGGAGGGATAANQELEIAALDSIDSKTTKVDTDNVTVVTSTLPTGAATESKQDAIISAVQSLDNKTTVVDTSNVSVTSSVLPTGAATDTKQDIGNTSLASIDGKVPSGLTVSSTRLLTDGSGVTQPISAASLPLPAGAATESTLSTLSGKVPSGLTITSTRLLVDGSGVTQPISGSVTANIGTTNGLALDARVSTSQPRKMQDGSGNDLTSASVGSNRALHVENVGYANAEFARNDYSSVNVTTSAYVTLIASTATEYHEIQIFDSSGQTLKLATGAAASEVDKIIIPPGGTNPIKLRIASGTRISIKAVSATASVGEIDVQLLG